MQGKSVDYSPSKINVLLHLQPPSMCSILNKRGVSMTGRMCERMLEEFYQPRDV